MKLKIFLVSIIMAAGVVGVFAQASERVIKLKDSGVLQGEVLSKEGDVYKVSTKALGIVSVKDADIVSMGEAPQVPVSPPMEIIKERIVSNPGLMESVMVLTQDPGVSAMLADPELKSAILRQDIDFLKNNEKFLQFMQNPAVEKIVQEAAVTVMESKGD